jgi:arylsulfatase A-like enzyme
VILVEDLGFGSFSCGEDSRPEQAPGFEAFCEEAVRFTHAYTPSTMSQATVASILTGLYPREHSVRHNGPVGLNPAIETVAEVAKRRGYQTSFFSGGPPIWRRAAFNQGFDLFDDTISVSLRHLYRPASEVINLFLGWQETEAPHGRFFSMLYFSDLQFLDEPTVNELGDVRENSYHSQVEAVGQSLANLVREMKKRKIWDSTDVVLVGLNGYVGDVRPGEPAALNLFSESTRSTLMIKPSRRKREGPFNWKIDTPVSLVDLSATLYDLVDPVDNPPLSKFLTVSLRTALEGPTASWPADRPIVSESAWSQWREGGGIRASVRKGPYFFLFDQHEQVLNTLTDTLETTPAPRSDKQSEAARQELESFLMSLQYSPWEGGSTAAFEKAILGRDIWRSRGPDNDALKRLQSLARRFPYDEEIIGWRAIWALRRGNWKELKTLALALPDTDSNRASWLYVASKNLEEKSEIPLDPCFAFLKDKGHEGGVARDCRDAVTRDLIAVIEENAEIEHGHNLDEFLRAYSTRALTVRVAEYNAVTGLQWDTSPGQLNAPDTVDLILALPEYKKLKSLAHARVFTETK